MPFHLPHHHHTHSEPSNTHNNYYSATNAIFQSGQTLGSVGAPTTYYDPKKTSISENPEQRAYPQDSTNTHPSLLSPNPIGYTSRDQSLTVGLSSHPPSAYDHTRHIGRLQENSQVSQPGSAMSDVHHYGAPPSYGNDNATPNHQLPGTLQPGLPQRPNMHIGPVNTAPAIPTLPQIQTQMQQPPSSARPSTNHSHSYSRSSPGGFDTPKYKPFSNKTPETTKYISPTSNYAPPPGQGPSSYSPLGLADIRPRADTVLSGNTFSPEPIVENVDIIQYPTNSNYVTPWPIYAADWCKWTPKGSNVAAGKVAIGSYLEDNHNYV
jgi:hypothetical protein